jgi:hypothetical protein
MGIVGYIIYINPIFKVYVHFFSVTSKCYFGTWQTWHCCSAALSPSSTFSFKIDCVSVAACKQHEWHSNGSFTTRDIWCYQWGVGIFSQKLTIKVGIGLVAFSSRRPEFDKHIMSSDVLAESYTLNECHWWIVTKIKVLTSVPLFWYDNFILRVLNISPAVKSVWSKQGEPSQVLLVLPHLGCLNYLAWLHTL